MVSFPENYPLEVFQVTIPEDQDLPSIMGRHVEKFSQDWLQAKHATVQLLGQPELLFRPFLRWLDRNMERLFTEGARLLKRELAAERAGIQFIPFRDLSGTKSTSPPHSPLLATQDSGQSTTDVSEEEIKKKPSQEDCELHGEEESAPYEYDNCEEEIGGARDRDSTPATMRKGTEVKLLGLSMGEDTGILIAQSLALLLQCTRCKAKEEVRVSAEGASSAECSKCHAQLSAKAHFSTAHHKDPVLGKLNLQFCHAVELLLQTSQLALTCLHCSLKHPLVGLCYGVKREFNCRHCHRRLSVLIEGVRLYSFEPTLEATANSVILKSKNYNKGAVIQPGKPLPGNGTCKHYKKSFRWLRFPCCGRAYPCDLCHNEDQSHEMELATRMICGFCAREQPYSNGKACLGCGSFMTNSNFTPHWEGGQGCRNQIRMSRKDKQKYSNSNKTVSRKATALQGKR
uniref:Si:dkey-24l11.2 n=1 Tax=Eptatretus burgeri TaxID=7764 RepID=A0A8C4QHB4_EPTBU